MKGTPNHATKKLRTFLEGCCDAAIADPRFKRNIVEELATLRMDAKLMALIFNHVAGMPARQVELSGTVAHSLERIVTGVGIAEDDEEDDDEPVAGAPAVHG